MAKYSQNSLRVGLWIVFAVLLCGYAVHADNTAQAKYALYDVRVMYLTDNAESIDWPTLYYLNDRYGCRVDVALLQKRAVYRTTIYEAPDREIFFYTCGLPSGDTQYLDSVASTLFGERYPDLVLYSSGLTGPAESFRQMIASMEPSATRWFNILRIYEQADKPSESTTVSGQVVLNGNELAHRYRERMERELPLMNLDYENVSKNINALVHYQLVVSDNNLPTTGGDFLSGMPQLRLTDILDESLSDTPKKKIMMQQAKQFIASFRTAEQATGKEYADLMLKGYRSLEDLMTAISGDQLLKEREDFPAYFAGLSARAERATLKAVGVHWNGKVILRDSSHGPKLKFRASLAADGPEEVKLVSLKFLPYWDTTVVYLDSIPREITPHQAFVREYLVDIDQQYFEANQPESLVFTAEIRYGELSLTAHNTLPLWEKPQLTAQFEPDFYFIPPMADLDIDRVIATTTMRVIVGKPSGFAGKVKLNLRTPRGLFAGAYLKELELEKGKTYETVRIPFSISKLFELGVQHLTVELTYQDHLTSVDTALVRVASCRIADTVKIGFLPDTTGHLEDLLSMTEAAYRPLTDRGLMTAALDAYNVIIVGSGAFRNYPSLRNIKDRLEKYIRDGGSLVILGQPEDWPEGVLPVSFIPAMELVDRAGITNLIKQARILNRPYDISETNLLSSFYKPREVISAVVAPAEKVFVTPSGGTLLSISRLGDGQLIYCGLPLLELISTLDIDAIHLFANIVNY